MLKCWQTKPSLLHRFVRNFSTEPFRFEIIHKSSKSRARVGKIHTPHGIVDTPGFVPVATNAAIKSVDHTLVSSGIQLMFCNTYHLILHPGSHVVLNAGGLHKYMNFKTPLITDSGGFQIFSLSEVDETNEELKGKGFNTLSFDKKGGKKYDSCIIKIEEEGVTFRSYRDGEKIFLTPESSIEHQKNLGADIIIPLDELPANNVSPEKLQRSFDRTHRWEKRSLNAHLANPKGQAIYSVIHGGTDKELRKRSTEILCAQEFNGHAIGGSLGKDKQEMEEIVRFVTPLIPSDKPIHLLGIGDLESIEKCIPLGIDTLDSAYPTRAARHGNLLSKDGGVRIRQSIYKEQFDEPIDKGCTCHTCKHFSRAYLHHLHKANEPLFETLATMHNIHFMFEKMMDIRLKILRDEI